MTDEEASGAMLAENTAREALNPIDEGRAYQKRMEKYGWSADECAQKAGVHVVRVHARVKLLSLAPHIQDLARLGHFPLKFAQTVADYRLQPGYQDLALRSFRDRSNPTPIWFRNVCAVLAEKQAEGATDLFSVGASSELQLATAQADASLYDPLTYAFPSPPAVTLSERLTHQAAQWLEQAASWRRAGNFAKEKQCQAVHAVLTGLLTEDATRKTTDTDRVKAPRRQPRQATAQQARATAKTKPAAVPGGAKPGRQARVAKS